MKKVLLILVLVIAFVQNVDALEITFQSSGSVDESVIRLGDIAGLDEESEMARALASLIVGQAPSPGKTSSLRSLSIKEFLISSQSLPQGILWSGSPTVTVLRRAVTVGPEKIQTIIAEYLKENQNNLPDAEIRFVPSSLPLPFTLPTGDLTHEILPSKPGILGSSRFSIIFRVSDKVVKNMSVRGKVEALADVVVSVGPLKKKQILRPQHLTTTLMDIGSRTNPVLDFDDLLGKKLKKSLRAGSPVLLSMVETLPVVQKGERVKIVINSGPLHISATGIARSDGIKDQMIRVQNINSNKIVHCRVTAPGLVEVML
ncbi:MAG: flagellar basal body P-ring formation protein FlgA [Desulfobulbaceae bacterium]|nr:flagellar basal body P-ring formation protein FlgA [Desulfobulbaceae bacterium]